MTVPLVGKARRRCPECGVEIEVTRPPRAMSALTTRSQRDLFAKELRRQILWEAVMPCDSCKAFWNELIRRIAPESQGGGAHDAQPA